MELGSKSECPKRTRKKRCDLLWKLWRSDNATFALVRNLSRYKEREHRDSVLWEEYPSLMARRACRMGDVVASLGKNAVCLDA